MRKFKIITGLILIFLILAACKPGNPEKGSGEYKSGDAFTIVTSFHPVYVSTLNIVGSVKSVNVINMTKPQTGCLHDYQLTPQDRATLEQADVFVINGAGMEAFLDDVIAQQKDLAVIDASKGIDLIKDESGEVNPHVWVSVENAVKQVKNITEELAELNPENAEDYKRNAEIYIARLENLSEHMHGELDGLKNRGLITSHQSFPYFAQEFGFEILAVIEREHDQDPSAAERGELIKIIKNNDIKVIFIEPNYESGAADSIAKETGVRVLVLDPGVVGKENENIYDSYIDTMTENMRVLKTALT